MPKGAKCRTPRNAAKRRTTRTTHQLIGHRRWTGGTDAVPAESIERIPITRGDARKAIRGFAPFGIAPFGIPPFGIAPFGIAPFGIRAPSGT
jgi:hypothetical protein